MRHGSQLDPPNRFERTRTEADREHLEWDDEYLNEPPGRRIEYLPDDTQTIVAENNSPDIPFRYTVNPYRGCVHGCAYCYARPGHEYLGFNGGLDFETKIMVKHRAPELLRAFLSRDRWQPESITFSGVTDCYQPAEREFQLTRGCLQVAAEFNQPVGVITKNALVARDIDIFKRMAASNLVHVFVSVTTLDAGLARAMEPRTSIPAARLRAVRMLADAGVPTGVMVAPIIPGLNDSEIPTVLAAAKQAGASSAGYVLLRLPLTVRPVFEEWLARTQPAARERVESRIRSCRSGEMNDSDFGRRLTGTGPIADQIKQTFQVFAKKHGLANRLPPLSTTHFQVPRPTTGQLRLFS
ncbi:MAG: PA0069 family radical SAM protein [Planctomycetales bacterium]|nr:PA0069 family radical SAM protein [Planctomycetales bacterium]